MSIDTENPAKTDYFDKIRSLKEKVAMQLRLHGGFKYEDREVYLPYLKELIDNDRRYEHSLSVARLAYDVAFSQYGEEFARKAYIAGAFHDCAKGAPIEAQASIVSEHFNAFSNVKPWAYHQFVGSYFAQAIFDIEDEDILNAISWHATGNKEMSLLSRIIYACDKIDPRRGYDSKFMIDAMKNDAETGFLLVLSENLKFYKKKEWIVDDPYAVACFEYFLGTRK